MTTDTSWITEGARIAVHSRGHFQRRVRFATIARLTKTQIVLDDGERFNRETLRPVGDKSITWRTETTELLPLDDPQVRDTRALNQLASLRSKVDARCKDFRGDADEVLAALTEIEALVRSARERIAGAAGVAEGNPTDA